MKRVKATGDSKGMVVEVDRTSYCLRRECPKHSKTRLAVREINEYGRIVDSETINLTRSQVRRLIKHLEEASHE